MSRPAPRTSARSWSFQDRHLIYLAAFLRATGISMLAILAGAYFLALGMGSLRIGAITAAGLAGCTVAAATVTFVGDRVGRRWTLTTIALLACVGTTFVALASEPWLIGGVGFLGMFNAMGRDRGAALVLEQAILPATASDDARTATFARYHVAQDLGHAAGAGAAALPVLLRLLGLDEQPALRCSIIGAALLFCASSYVYTRLSAATEAMPGATDLPMSAEGRRVVGRISALFLLDSVGGGFLTTSWLSVFFIERFSVSVGIVSALFVGARVLNAASHLAAAWLAARIGLVRTMVFAHLPSSVLLLTVAFAPNFPIAALLFLLREGLVEMDVPTRQSYLMAVVDAQDRTRASGITSIVRMGGWTLGQAAAGAAGPAGLGVSIAIGAGMKITYDLLLFAAFRRHRAPEES